MIKLYNGDCLEVMDKLIAEGVRVDAIMGNTLHVFNHLTLTTGKTSTDVIGKQLVWDNNLV